MLRDDVRRPTLVGMNNPLSDRPEMALWPSPPGCTGWRIWKMLEDHGGVGPQDYVEAFDRVNILNSQEFSARRARAAAADLLRRLGGRTRVVVLGAAPLAALRLPPLQPGHWHQFWRVPPAPEPTAHGPKPIDPEAMAARLIRYTCLPHPSGRCRWYNDHDNRRLARHLLWDLWTEWQDEIATAPAAG